MVAVNLGWDERFKHLSAPRLAILSMIEEGFRRGDRRFNLGWGRVDYKREFTNGSDAATWEMLFPIGSQLPLTLAHTAPALASRRMRQSAKRLLPADEVDRLRVLRKRISRMRQ